MYLLCKSIYITHPSTLLDIITSMECNYISFFCHSDASIFRIKSNRVSNGLDTTFIFERGFCVGYYELFCKCGLYVCRTKKCNAKQKLAGRNAMQKNDVSVTFEMACYFQNDVS